MPSLTIALWMSCSSAARARRTANQSSHRSWPSTVAHDPSVMESPKATTVPAEVRLCTSMAFSHHIDVVVAPNGSPISSAVTSPAPSALR